jgi:hypothetical protein
VAKRTGFISLFSFFAIGFDLFSFALTDLLFFFEEVEGIFELNN